MWPRGNVTSDKEQRFTELMTQYYSRVAKFCGYRLHQQPFICEEVVQDVFLALYNQMDHLANHENLCGWLYKTADNLAKQACRKLRTEKKHLECGNMADEEYGACAQLVYEEDFQAIGEREIDVPAHVQEIVRQLSEDDRFLWKAYFHEGMSAHALSNRLGLEENTVKSRIFRLKKRLKLLVQAQLQQKDFAG